MSQRRHGRWTPGSRRKASSCQLQQRMCIPYVLVALLCCRGCDSARLLKSSVGRKLQLSAAICCLAKDVEPYLLEWVDYHLALGFKSVYVYDNSDAYELKDWARNQGDDYAAAVKFKHFPGLMRQMAAYKDCTMNYAKKDQHTWVAFIDTDEFLMLRKHEHVVDFLSEHCGNGAIGVNWIVFGTGNQTNYKPQPVTKRFTYKAKGVNKHVKVIAKVSDISNRQAPNPHVVVLSRGHHKDTSGKVFHGPFNPGGPIDVAALYHYWTKSVEEFRHKACVRGRAMVAGRMRHSLCGPNGTVKPFIGTEFDDDAWTAMKKHVPKYSSYDD